jgi:FixJ family two-component response regulator
MRGDLMLIRIIYEHEEMAMIREKLKTLNMRELVILEEILQREKTNRQQELFDEWLDVLEETVGGYPDNK